MRGSVAKLLSLVICSLGAVAPSVLDSPTASATVYPANVRVCVDNATQVMRVKTTCNPTTETREMWSSGLVTPLVRTVCVLPGGVLGYSSDHNCGRGVTAIDFTVRGLRDKYIYACVSPANKTLIRTQDASTCTGKVVRWLLTKQEPATCANRGAACEVGDVGPGGGIVFFVDDADEYGFTFLEAAASNWYRGGDKIGVYMGCDRRSGRLVKNTPQQIGTGEATTALLYDICINNLTGADLQDRAAKDASEYSYKGLDDWFLPSWDEAQAMRTVNGSHPVNLDPASDLYCTTRVEINDHGTGPVNEYFAMLLNGSYGVSSSGGQCTLRPIRAE